MTLNSSTYEWKNAPRDSAKALVVAEMQKYEERAYVLLL